jgi:serine/threonine protein kinase
MLTGDGAKLLDFGLARANAGSDEDSDLTVSPTVSKPLTAAGTVIGTYQYMAPEQLEGKTADARTDIFALGAMLYEIASGRRAFTADTQASLIGAIMHEQPQPVSAVQPMIPPAFDRVVQSCLAKDPDERWQTAHDVKLQLQWIAEGGSVVGLPAPVAARRKSRERLAWIASAIAVLAAALFAVGYVRRAPAPLLQTRFEIAPPPELVTVGSPRISPDGRSLVFRGVDSRDLLPAPRAPRTTLDRCGPRTAGTSPSSSVTSSKRSLLPAGRRRRSATRTAPTVAGAQVGRSCTMAPATLL